MRKLFRRLSALLCVFALCITSASALSVEDALKLLETDYVGEIPAAAYEAKTLDELFEIIGDPYTYYMSEEEYQSFRDNIEQESSVSGIGILLEYTSDGLLITGILPGGSAKDAGLCAGDYIIAVGDVKCVPATEAHRNLIRGEAGTFVDITVRHTNGTVRDYRLERRLVEIHNTVVTYVDGVGQIDCNSFSLSTSDFFFEGFETYPDANLWVVDLRSNGGGIVDAATSILGLIGRSGCKLIYRASNGDAISSSIYSKRMTHSPVIALVNGLSASSTEILTGGIRAEKVGIMLGSRTYGKGTAQIIYDKSSLPELFDGDAIKISIYRFYNADGCTTDKIGVLPTLLVDDALAADAAALLSVKQPDQGEYLTLMLNDHTFYLDLSANQSAARTELLSALPPDLSVFLNSGNSVEKLSAAQALARFGDETASRCFTDVSNSPYATQINTLGTYRILGGVGDGRFDPTRALTRAEMAAVLSQMLQLDEGPSGLFSDVADDSWYTEEVGAIATLGFMNGVGDGRFAPEETLTQEQFIAIMGRLVRFLNCNTDDFGKRSEDIALSDDALAGFASYARPGAYVLAHSAGNMLYTDIGNIDPHASVTREQAAATLCNSLKALHILSY